MPRFLTPHVETLCVVLDILLITPFILECLLTFDSGQQVIFILKEHSRLKIDCEQSLFLFRFSKGSARPRECWAAKQRDARNEGGAFSHARGHLRVSSSLSFCSDLVRGVHARASVERRSSETRETRAADREEKRETARFITQNTIGWCVKRWQQTVNNRFQQILLWKA